MIRIIREGLDDFDFKKQTKEFDDLFGFSGLNKIPKECIIGTTLLSKEEAQNLLTKEERKCEYNGKPWWWWLRSPGHRQDYAAYVYRGGSVDYYGNGVYNAHGCVRPALILNLQSSNLKIGDHFEFSGYDFKIIDKNLALCEEIIGACAFREDWEAEDANDYEKSDVKKYVDNWFNNAYAKYK